MPTRTKWNSEAFCAVLLLLALIPSPIVASGNEFNGKVVGVHDGDSITVLKDDKTQVKVRLSSIDAPELKQAFGAAAKKALSDLVFGKTVRVKDNGQDGYRRTLGDIYVGDTWVNLAMVEQGMAWLFRKYSHDKSLAAAEAKAKENHVGLWRDKEPVSPWEWRSKKKKQ